MNKSKVLYHFSKKITNPTQEHRLFKRTWRFKLIGRVSDLQKMGTDVLLRIIKADLRAPRDFSRPSAQDPPLQFKD